MKLPGWFTRTAIAVVFFILTLSVLTAHGLGGLTVQVLILAIAILTWRWRVVPILSWDDEIKKLLENA